MARSLSMMRLVALVPTIRMHEVDAKLEEVGGDQIMWRPHRVNDGLPVQVTPKGPPQGMNIRERSAEQQAWVAKHAKGEFNAHDLLAEWQKAGFRKEGLYGALHKATVNKMLKKLNVGKYRRVG